MVAYSDLTESEKQYDRDMAFNTIKLVKKLGYDLSRRNWSGMRCPSCGAHVGMTDAYCRCCGEKLSSK
jgi:predicted amidophosphoribosyltransferase